MIDVHDGLVQTGYGFGRKDQFEVFRAPILLRGRFRRHAEMLQRLRIAPKLHFGLREPFSGLRIKNGRDVAMHQNGLQRVADAGFLAFGVLDDVHRHLHIGIGVHIHMANAVVVFNHGHARRGDYFFDQALPATRDDEVDEAVHARHVLHTGPVRERNELDAVRRQPGRLTTGLEGRGERAIALDRLGTAAQDRGVARFEAERGRIGRHIRPGFKNDADHTNRNAHFADVQAVWTRPLGQQLAHRVWQSRHLGHGVGDALQALRVEREAVNHRAGEAVFTRPGQIDRIRGEDHVLPSDQLRRHRAEDGVLLLRGQVHEPAGGRTRAAAHVEDGRLDFRVGHDGGG